MELPIDGDFESQDNRVRQLILRSPRQKRRLVDSDPLEWDDWSSWESIDNIVSVHFTNKQQLSLSKQKIVVIEAEHLNWTTKQLATWASKMVNVVRPNLSFKSSIRLGPRYKLAEVGSSSKQVGLLDSTLSPEKQD